MSLLVMKPTIRLPCMTGRQPMPRSAMMRAASSAAVSSETQTTSFTITVSTLMWAIKAGSSQTESEVTEVAVAWSRSCSVTTPTRCPRVSTTGI